MRICRTIGLILLLSFALTPCRAQLPKSLRLRPSFALKMSMDDWENYCEEKGGNRKEAMAYYCDCQSAVNKQRLRQFSPLTRKQWRRTAYEIHRWFDVYWAWWMEASSGGSAQFWQGPHAYFHSEACLFKVMKGYIRRQGSRPRSRKRLNRAFRETRSQIAELAKAGQPERQGRVDKTAAALRKANRRLRLYALQKSPNTMKAIADGVEKMISEGAW